MDHKHVYIFTTFMNIDKLLARQIEQLPNPNQPVIIIFKKSLQWESLFLLLF